jgi:alkanesulfonate monooxygenase SsuD/methylene tetrahydromethanopterin reductase-like flavin-dependent oxidoreductase (luciferase family)
VVVPALREGATNGGRDPATTTVSASVLTASDPSQEDFVRSQIAFYASTPSYRSVMELHGWGDAADRLSALARRGEWGEMPAVIDDDMLHTFAVVAGEGDLARELRARYAGLIDRVTLYLPFHPGERDGFWQSLARGLGDGFRKRSFREAAWP